MEKFSTTPQRALGLDVGEARVGVAMSDPLGITAQPHSTLQGTPAQIISAVLSIITDNRVNKIVIGLPLELSGDVGPQATKVMQFSKKLNDALLAADIAGVTIDHIDERLTTAQAKRVMVGSKLKNKSYSAGLDRVSAAIILETYLAQKR